MSSAISIGTTGLTACAKQMDVIGNNLANSNTLGFKTGSVYFASMLNQSLSNAGGEMSVGSGVAVAAITTQFTQGSFENTNNATDLAIDGDGFFMVRDLDGAQYFTRAGAFHISNEGYLVDANNYRVQGYNATNIGSDDQVPEAIVLGGLQSQPEATTKVSMGINLDDTSDTGTKFNVSQSVFDSKGRQHNLSTTFQKTEQASAWGFTVKLDDSNYSTEQAADGFLFDEYGQIDKMYRGNYANATATSAGGGTIGSTTLNKAGQIYKATAADILLTKGAGTDVWTVTNNGGYSNAAVTASGTEVGVDLDGAGGADITFTLAGTWAANDTLSFGTTYTEMAPENLDLSFGTLSNNAFIGTYDGTTASNQVTWNIVDDDALTITGYASAAAIKSLSADGYTTGDLKNINIAKDGIVYGYFTNGQTSELAEVLLANFQDPTGLQKVGNYFGISVRSGEPIINAPGSGGVGELISSTLEISNTDTAKEFVNMIQAQRAYQSNARVITTADQMLSELMNIKR